MGVLIGEISFTTRKTRLQTGLLVELALLSLGRTAYTNTLNNIRFKTLFLALVSKACLPARPWVRLQCNGKAKAFYTVNLEKTVRKRNCWISHWHNVTSERAEWQIANEKLTIYILISAVRASQKKIRNFQTRHLKSIFLIFQGFWSNVKMKKILKLFNLLRR